MIPKLLEKNEIETSTLRDLTCPFEVNLSPGVLLNLLKRLYRKKNTGAPSELNSWL